jgi:hypothetical protein
VFLATLFSRQTVSNSSSSAAQHGAATLALVHAHLRLQQLCVPSNNVIVGTYELSVPKSERLSCVSNFTRGWTHLAWHHPASNDSKVMRNHIEWNDEILSECAGHRRGDLLCHKVRSRGGAGNSVGSTPAPSSAHTGLKTYLTGFSRYLEYVKHSAAVYKGPAGASRLRSHAFCGVFEGQQTHVTKQYTLMTF